MSGPHPDEFPLRPWDDPDDPRPDPFFVDGRWTEEGVEWVKRSGKRRADFMFPEPQP